jgi:CRISPR system Cascade subunit CasA
MEAGRALEAAVASVTNSIERAAAAYDAARAELYIARQQTVPTAEAIAAQADREFELGAIDRGEWVASQAGLAAAKFEEALAEQTALEARSLLEEALRQPLGGPELQIGAALAPMDGDTP